MIPYRFWVVRRARAAILMTTVVVMVVLIGFAALTIDIGLIQMCRVELQRTADSAALAAGWNTDGSHTEERTLVEDAAHYAGLHSVLQDSFALDPGVDVQIGVYDRTARTFASGAGPANAVRVVARRTEGSPSGPIPLYFASILGHRTADVQADAVVLRQVEGSCYSRGIVAREVTIAAGARTGNACIYGRDRVHISAGAEAIDDTYIGSRDVSNIKFPSGKPYGFLLEEHAMEPEAALNVATIIDNIEDGSNLEAGTTIRLINMSVMGGTFNLNALQPNTAYVFTGDIAFRGEATVEGVILAVRGNAHFGNASLLRNGAGAGDPGAQALALLATGEIHFSTDASLTGVEIIAGVDVRFASGAGLFEGSIEAGGTVHAASGFEALNSSYITRFRSNSDEPETVVLVR